MTFYIVKGSKKMSVLKDCIDIKCKWEKFDDVTQIKAKRGSWLGKVKWYEDGHFHGYSVRGEGNQNNISDYHIIIGFLDENLGISIIQIASDPKYPPKLYRGALKPDGTFEGDFYAVLGTKIIVQDIYSGGSVDFNKVDYRRVGRGKFEIDSGMMDYLDSSFIDELDKVGKMGLEDVFAREIYNKYNTEESLKEFREDLIENVYPYENGANYSYAE